MDSSASDSFVTPSRFSSKYAYFTTYSPYTLRHTLPTVCSDYPYVSPLLSIEYRWYRNLYLLSIDYDFRPRLRPRLTLSGRTFLRKPRIFGGQDSHLPCATHANILSCVLSTKPFDLASAYTQCSPTIHLNVSVASVLGFSPVYLRREVTRLVSYYALFECMAASKPTS